MKQVLPLVLSNLMDWSNFGLAKLQVFSDKHGKIKKIRIFILFGPANALQLWIQQLTLWSWRSTLLHRNITKCEHFHLIVAARLLKHRIQSSIYFKKILLSCMYIHKVPKSHKFPKDLLEKWQWQNWIFLTSMKLNFVDKHVKDENSRTLLSRAKYTLKP